MAMCARPSASADEGKRFELRVWLALILTFGGVNPPLLPFIRRATHDWTGDPSVATGAR